MRVRIEGLRTKRDDFGRLYGEGWGDMEERSVLGWYMLTEMVVRSSCWEGEEGLIRGWNGKSALERRE
jgi:hypothetical protein